MSILRKPSILGLLLLAAAPVPAGTSAVLVRGDANGDGRVDISDVVALVNHLKGSAAISLTSRPGADANGDGRIDISDVVTVVNMIHNGKIEGGATINNWSTQYGGSDEFTID